LRDVAELDGLVVPGTMPKIVAILTIFFVGHFLSAPSMRENCVHFIWEVWKFLELERSSVENAHIVLL
jgi:hypothetical protein